jgi:hypothetical protein
MNPRELVDHIRSGPAKLALDEPLRFRRRTRSNPCDFNEFLQALQSSETIRTVECESQQKLGISEEEWVLLVKTLGSIKGIRSLILHCRHGSRDFHPYQSVADTVSNAHSLRKLLVTLVGQTFPRDPSGISALANALRKHTRLQEFRLFDCCPLLESEQSTALDPVLRALSACPHLQLVLIKTQFASADAIRNLLQLPTDTILDLALTSDQWLTVADEIRLGRCLIKSLNLRMFSSSSSEATEAVEAVASAIREDRHLESLELRMEDGFTDEAGVALAEALTINKTLQMIILDDNLFKCDYSRALVSLGAQAYEAFGAMLRVNTSIKLELPSYDANIGDQNSIDHFNQIRIEQRLNEVGRGRLLDSCQTPREQWVNALQELNASHDDDEFFEVSCLYILLRLNPLVCLLELNHTTNSGL